ncbi:MAG: NAD(P)/FAD-dependent oxidoreductase [Aigarchaeota archaeon]|nr:NAD(P)/FAD-dependent oxidoreductase [Aigarchaeota archaeon]
MIEIAVIGGGPAGLLAAREAARKGVEVTVFERDLEIGEPERCAGLLSLSGLKRLSVGGLKKYLQNEVKGAVFHAESGREYFLDAKRTVAVIVSRKLFDQKLAEDCEGAGVRIFTGVRVKKVSKSGIFEIYTTTGVFHAPWVIDAEGAGSALLRKIVGKAPEPNGWIPITQFTVRGHGLPKDYVHLYFTSQFPDFFAYFIPIDEEHGRVGAASRIAWLSRKLESFLRREFPNAKILKKTSHVIYVGAPLRDLCLSHRFVPVGDAAGHVKATTGGGVVMGGLISMNLASAMAEHLRGGDPKPYLARARKMVGELIEISCLRNLLYRVPQGLREFLLKVTTSNPMAAYLARFGDMDFQSSTFLRCLGLRRGFT